MSSGLRRRVTRTRAGFCGLPSCCAAENRAAALERMVWTPVHPDGNDIGVVSDADRLCFVRVCAGDWAGAAGFPAYADRYWVTVCAIVRLPGPDNIEIEGKTQPMIKRRLQKSFDMITPI